jgi:hypothetical protein
MARGIWIPNEARAGLARQTRIAPRFRADDTGGCVRIEGRGYTLFWSASDLRILGFALGGKA